MFSRTDADIILKIWHVRSTYHDTEARHTMDLAEHRQLSLSLSQSLPCASYHQWLQKASSSTRSKFRTMSLFHYSNILCQLQHAQTHQRVHLFWSKYWYPQESTAQHPCSRWNHHPWSTVPKIQDPQSKVKFSLNVFVPPHHLPSDHQRQVLQQHQIEAQRR